MTIARTAALRHLTFFEHLAASRETATEWAPAQAGLLLLRELDERFAAESAGTPPQTVEALRTVVARVDERSRTKRPLAVLVEELGRPANASFVRVFAALIAFGRALQQEVSPTIAADVFDSLRDYAAPRAPSYAREAELCRVECAQVQH